MATKPTRIYRIKIYYIEAGERKHTTREYYATEKTFKAEGEKVRLKFFADNPGAKDTGDFDLYDPV